MANVKTKFSVGLFVIIGFSMVVVAVIWLGMSNYLEKGQFYVAFFDESVQGLDKDSPVKYRGVSIGRVHHIGVASDANLIEVVLKIEAPMNLQEEIVAQLKSVGITGIMYVELERKAPGEPDLSPRIRFPTKYPVIATRPSGIKQLFDAISVAINQFNALDVQGITQQLQAALEKMTQAVGDAQVEALSAELRTTLKNAQAILAPHKWDGIIGALEKTSRALPRLVENTGHTLQKIDTMVSGNDAVLQDALQSFRSASAQADQFFADGTDFLQSERVDLTRLQASLETTLETLEMATISIDRLMDIISAHPAQLLLGTPPPESVTDDGHP